MVCRTHALLCSLSFFLNSVGRTFNGSEELHRRPMPFVRAWLITITTGAIQASLCALHSITHSHYDIGLKEMNEVCTSYERWL